eukprot:3269107-Amphidinium_carterae.1
MDDLVVIPEPEPNTTSADVEGTPELISVKETASVTDEEWNFVADRERKPAGWQEGFDIIIFELCANLIESDIVYPMERGAVNGNPYDIARAIAEEAHDKSIEWLRWSMTDDRGHATHANAWGNMPQLHRADADAHGNVTINEDEAMEDPPELLPVRDQAVIGPEANKKDSNFYGSSRHLQIGVYNLGNLDRRWIRHETDHPVLKLLRDQPNHLQLLCEGQQFAKNGWDKSLAQCRWKVCSSRTLHLWCMARCAPDGYIHLLVENCESSTPVYFAFFEVHWGTASRGFAMERANMMFSRVAVIHADHRAARTKPSLTRDALASICALCTAYQIDVMGGDFNASIYRYFASSHSLQRCASLADSPVGAVLRATRKVVNEELQRQGKLEETWLGDI